MKKTDIDNKLRNVTSNKNELNELSKKVKAISTIRLTKDLINKFSIRNGAKYFSSGIFQNYLVFIPAKKHIKYVNRTTLVELWKSNRMSQENIKNITKPDSNLGATFIALHLLLDITFNGHCLIKNSISMPKKLIYFLHTNSMVKKFKHRIYME